VAKVTRDRIIENWKFNEPHYEADIDFGSGYPSDPKCKAWLEKHLGDAIFCYPDLVRFSWGPAKDAMKEKGVKIEWEADEDDQDEELKQQQGAFKAFMSGESINKKPRLAYFESRNLKRLTKLSMK
jgi:ribonuclease H2 subunit A